MTYNNLNSFVTLIQSQPELPLIVTTLAGLLHAGYKQSSLAVAIQSVTDSEKLPEDYEDELDDIIAAMEGWCDEDFILHPNNYIKNK